MPTIKVNGMKCQHCAASTKKALEDLDGVSSVEVDLEKAEVTYEGQVDSAQLKDALAAKGFELA